MEILLYVIIFIMGTFFGSFFTLAVYRIPLKQDILYTHSYCPNCKHKLNIIDLFPVISYIALRGKCRYCGNKIRIRYLLLEILSGLVFFITAKSFNFNIIHIEIYKIIEFIFVILFFTSLFIIAGIDKEKRNIQTSLLIYGFILSIGYILYVCTTNQKIVYSYTIYLLAMLLFLSLNEVLIHKKKNSNYLIQNLALVSYMLVFSNIISFILTIITTAIILLINYTIKKKINKISIGFYLCITNIVFTILINFIQYYHF